MSLTKVFRKAARLLVVGAMLLGAGVPTVLAKSDTEWFDDATDLMGKKKYAEAAAAFRESIKADPRYKEAWQGLADALKAQGKTEAAARAQKQADDAKAIRAGDPPPLTDEQKKALAE